MSKADRLRAELELVEAEEAYVAVKAAHKWPESRKPGQERPAEVTAAAEALAAVRSDYRRNHRGPAVDGAAPATVKAKAKT